MSEYQSFLARKAVKAIPTGFDPRPMPATMKPHEVDATAFAIRCGRAGLFLNTGLGKTFCQLEFCRQTAEESNGRALVLTPLAVARQFEREAHRWGYQARVIREQSEVGDGINICNYDRLDKLEPSSFGTVSLDESGILKSFTGATSRTLRQIFASHRFRLAATATPAPNDHMELGQHSEFLGVMDSNEMLARWFISDQTEMGRYRLKGHAEQSFWDWMSTWACMAESPADFGHDASEYNLPPFTVIRHRVEGAGPVPKDGLFAADASATNIHAIKRATTNNRSDAIAELVHAEPSEPWLIWVDTNYDADAILARIPEAMDVRGSMEADEKEEKLEAFATGKSRILLTKPSIAGHGMNFQHCARMAFVGRSFSYETWFQAVRRCWRFGQTRAVQVHLSIAEGEEQIGRVLDRKGTDHAKMMRAMSESMLRSLGRSSAIMAQYNPTHLEEIPPWLMAS